MKSNNYSSTTTRQPNPHLYHTVAGRKLPAMLPVDSAEVKQQYYRERISYLRQELDELNLMEHPIEIAFICGEISSTQKLLKALSLKPGKNRQLKA